MRGLRIGVLREDIDRCEPEVRASLEAALARLEALGCELTDARLPHAEHALSVYYIVATAEASSNLARFDGMRSGHAPRGETLLEDYVRARTEGFGPETKRRIQLGTFVLSAGYIDAY